MSSFKQDMPTRPIIYQQSKIAILDAQGGKGTIKYGLEVNCLLWVSVMHQLSVSNTFRTAEIFEYRSYD